MLKLHINTKTKVSPQLHVSPTTCFYNQVNLLYCAKRVSETAKQILIYIYIYTQSDTRFSFFLYVITFLFSAAGQWTNNSTCKTGHLSPVKIKTKALMMKDKLRLSITTRKLKTT